METALIENAVRIEVDESLRMNKMNGVLFFPFLLFCIYYKTSSAAVCSDRNIEVVSSKFHFLSLYIHGRCELLCTFVQ